MRLPTLLAVVGMAALTGVVWGPAIHAPWYGFIAAAGIAAVTGVVLAVLTSVVGMRSGASAGVVVLGVMIANFAFFFWAVTHSH